METWSTTTGPADGDFQCDAEAIAVVGFARKLLVVYPTIIENPTVLAALAADVRLLVSKISNQRLRQALEECLSFRDFLWNGSIFAAPVIDTRILAYGIERVAEGGSTGAQRTSLVPVRQPCLVPGKACWLVGRDMFEIDQEYTPIKRIGKGAYGIVCSAQHPARADKVAIKKIANGFEDVTDAHRTLREIKLLRCLRHDNIIALLDVMRPPDKERFRDVYLVYELMDTDLQEIIRSSQPLSNTHFQYFLCQILRGLKYIHSANVLHRDLKPSNMLVNSTCGLKICDFGLARTASASANVFMTEYVVTRWYRAPELLLSCDSYGPPIDIWSVGCILAELLGRQPLFAGRDYLDSLKLIIRQLGSPADSDLGFISSEKARQYIRGMPPTKRVDFRDQFPTAEPLAIDLLERMLCFDPRQRISVEDALAHPWLSELLDTALEPCAPVRFEFEYEEEQLTSERVRDLVYQDILSYAA